MQYPWYGKGCGHFHLEDIGAQNHPELRGKLGSSHEHPTHIISLHRPGCTFQFFEILASSWLAPCRLKSS